MGSDRLANWRPSGQAHEPGMPAPWWLDHVVHLLNKRLISVSP